MSPRRVVRAVLLRLGLGGLCLAELSGCASPGRSPPAAPEQAPASDAPPQHAKPSLELNADELLIRDRLRTWTEALRKFGVRDGSHPWELVDAAEYLTATFDSLGVRPNREAFEEDGVSFQSFSVEFSGQTPDAPRFSVLAYYDSSPSESEVQATASESPEQRGTLSAAMGLELVRAFSEARIEGALRIVFRARPPGASHNFDPLIESSRSSLGGLVLGARLGAAELVLTQLYEPIVLLEGAPPPLFSGAEDELARELISEPLGPASLSVGKGPVAPAAAVPGGLYLSGAADGKEPSAQAEENFELAALRVAKIRSFLSTWLHERPTNDQMVTPLYGALR